MSKVLGFMKQVARGLQVEGNFELLMSIAAVSMPLLLIVGKMILPSIEVTSEWVKRVQSLSS